LQGFATTKENLVTLLKCNQLTLETISSQQDANAIKQLSVLPALNLLHGDYRLNASSQSFRHLWRWPVGLLVLWIIMLAISSATKYFYLAHEQQQLTTKISALYREVYPQATSIISPRLRIEKELSQSGGSHHELMFLNLLTIAGQTLQQFPSIHLKALSFNDNQMTLNIDTNNFKSLEQFSGRLQQQGLTVKQNAVNREDQKVIASILLNRGEK
jgi:general secretion pathway protein L